MRSLKLTKFSKPLEMFETKTPEPEGKEVLLRVNACGVCHSDLHIWEGYYELGVEERMYVADRGVDLPLTLGHEVVGEVEQIGSDVKNNHVGSQRLIFPWIGCDTCKFCQNNQTHLCLNPNSIGIFRDGGFSDYILIPDEKYLVDIQGLKAEHACSYACAGLTAYSALKKAMPLDESENLIIIGAGGLGLMALQLIEELTSANVFVIDIDENKLKTVSEHTDFITINSKIGNTVDKVYDLTNQKGVSAIVDFVNNEETSHLAFNILQKNGKLIMVGLFGGKLTISNPLMPLKNLTIKGSYTGGLNELKELIAIVKNKNIKPIPIKKYGLDKVNEILAMIEKGEVTGRAVIDPNL